MLIDLLSRRRILVSAGPGGVGKTTVAASLGALAARAGRRTLVATIDPAPRLADALGVTLGADPAALPATACRALGIPEGSLYAARIDPALSFRRLVEAKVDDIEMRRRIFTNPIYRQMTTSLTGSQEYAATLALYDFHNSGAYDLVVLDTPPTANALDFLDAPHRIAEAVSSPVVSWFARSGEKAGRFSLRRLGSGGALILQRMGKFVGSRFLDDLGAFLADFQGVLGGFLDRARAIEGLLRQPEVGFLLVLAPELPAVDEALYFHSRLRSAGFTLDAFVANRVLPAPLPPGLAPSGLAPSGLPPSGVGLGLATTEALRREVQLAQIPGLAAWPPGELDAALRALEETTSFIARTAEAQRRELARLHERDPEVPLLEIPLLPREPASAQSLRAIGDRLAGAPRLHDRELTTDAIA
jgi:anion-transporting  ArsA/GET3 family ATPase